MSYSHKKDLRWWMELFFLWYQNPASEQDAGWRRYSGEAMMIDYHTRLTGEPIEHDLKVINDAQRLHPSDPDTLRIKDILFALPVEQYNALFCKYWYKGKYYPGLVFDKPPHEQKWQEGTVAPPRKFTDADRAQKAGQSLATFERNVRAAREHVCRELGIPLPGKEKAA